MSTILLKVICGNLDKHYTGPIHTDCGGLISVEPHASCLCVTDCLYLSQNNRNCLSLLLKCVVISEGRTVQFSLWLGSLGSWIAYIKLESALSTVLTLFLWYYSYQTLLWLQRSKTILNPCLLWIFTNSWHCCPFYHQHLFKFLLLSGSPIQSPLWNYVV